MPEVIEIKLGVPFDLHVNQTGNLESENINIRLLSLEDTRCPTGAICEDLGSVKLAFRVDIRGVVLGEFELDVFEGDFFAEERVDSYTLRAAKVRPLTKINREYSIQDYTVTTIFEELEFFS